MFVRARTRFKDGKTHRYWSVVENHRNRDVVQRQVLYLGEINDSQRAAWCRSVEVIDGETSSRQMALFPSDREAPELSCEVVRVKVLGSSPCTGRRQWGACWLALTLWDRLALDRFWGPRLPASRQGTRWLDVLKTQVCYQLIEPGSEVALAPALVPAQCDGGSAGRSAGVGQGHAVPMSGQAAGASPGAVLASRGTLADAVRGALRRAALRPDEHLLRERCAVRRPCASTATASGPAGRTACRW